MVDYNHAIEIVKQSAENFDIVCSYDSEDDFIFTLAVKDAKNYYGGSINIGVNKETGEIKESNLLGYLMIFEPNKYDNIIKTKKVI